jgi:GT2 family glycosyltransferase
MNTKVAIGIPTNRQIKPKTVLSIMNMVSQTQYKVFPIVASEGFTIAENRIYIMCQAIKNNCTHLFFVDDDMTFPPDTLDKLMEHKKEVVGVNLYSRCLPLRSTIIFLPESYDFNGDKINEPTIPDHIFEVEGVTGGCLLINLSIIDKLEKPWFGFKVDDFGVTLLGEDIWFTRRARSAGFKVWCDPAIKVGHLGEYNYSK